jgi:hypothetical protein
MLEAGANMVGLFNFVKRRNAKKNYFSGAI